MTKKLKRFNQLRGKLRQEVIEMYRDAVERKAPVREIEEFYDMADPGYCDDLFGRGRCSSCARENEL